MRKNIFKIAAVGGLAMMLVACSTGEQKEGVASTEAKQEETKQDSENKESTGQPIKITFWHDRGSDTDSQFLKKQVEEFNQSNGKGIVVEEVAKGYLDDVQAAVTTAIAAGEAPVLADLSCNGIPIFASEGVLADMKPYIERDKFDMNNVVKELQDYVYYENQIVSMPYTRGTAILYYNQNLFKEAGLDHAPGSLEELNQYAKEIYKKSNGEIQGIGYTIEPTYYQHYLLHSINGVGFIDKDGKSASCLEDGSMEKLLKDWYSWTEEGWCAIPALEKASSVMQEAFYNQKLAAFVSSSNRATSISKKAEEAGFPLGMGASVGYGGYAAPLGGGSVGIIAKGHNEEEIAAAWEFVKFLMEDKQVVANHIETGVLPVTYSAVETEEMKEFWAKDENAGYKLSYEQVKDASAPSMSIHTSEWTSAVKSAWSELIQARDISVEECINKLKDEAKEIFATS